MTSSRALAIGTNYGDLMTGGSEGVGKGADS
jgi:hypothetical protein